MSGQSEGTSGGATVRRPYSAADIRTLDYNLGQITFMVSWLCLFEVIGHVLGYLPSDGFKGMWFLVVFLITLFGGYEYLRRGYES